MTRKNSNRWKWKNKLDNYWNIKNPEKSNSYSETLIILNEGSAQLVNVKHDYIKNCKTKEL